MAACRLVAERDCGMAVVPHALVDVALREPDDRLARLRAALAKSVERLGLD